MVQDLGFFESKLGPRLGQSLVQDFRLFPKFYSILGISKSQIVCRGAKICFWQFVMVSRKGFSKKNVHFLLLSFLCWKKKMRKYEKLGKENFRKNAQQNCVLGGCEQKRCFFAKMTFLEKLANTICVRKVKKNAHFRCNYLFWENGTFL